MKILLLMIAFPAIAAPPPKSWVEDRVKSSKERLQKSQAGQLIWESIKAHGGLNQWFSQGAIKFRWKYQPNKGPVRDSYQTVDSWNSKARHKLTSDPKIEFGWDGKKAWQTADLPKGYNARFWSLTPYYFLAMPFVFADPGVNLESKGIFKFEGRTFDLVRITYGENVGDSPDDFYIALINQKTKLLEGVRYVVTYSGFFKAGESSPEKIMMFDDHRAINGIKIPTAARSFAWLKDKVGKQNVTSKISDIAFDSAVGKKFFEVPKGAKIQKGM